MRETTSWCFSKEFEDLKKNEDLILKEYADEWKAAYTRFDLAQAAISGDGTALAKFDNAEVAMAKAEVANAVRKYGTARVADVRSVARLVAELKAAVERRDDRLFGVGKLAKRSQRFAMASERKYYGPAATVTAIGAK